MSDPTYATAAKLKAFANPTTSSISAAETQFGARVRAHYFYTGVMRPPQEFGTIGFEDEGHRYPKIYKKVF